MAFRRTHGSIPAAQANSHAYLVVALASLATLATLSAAENSFVGDTTPPVLSALALSPAAVDVASALDVVVVTTTITDDLSGVAASTLCGWAYHGSPSQIRFESPSGGQIQDGIAESLGGDTYALRVTVPQYAEQGTWTVVYHVPGGLSRQYPYRSIQRIWRLAATR